MTDLIVQSWPLVVAAASGALLASMFGHALARRPQRWGRAVVRAGAVPLTASPDAAPMAVQESAADEGEMPPPAIARIAESRAARRMLRPEVAVMYFLEFIREREHTGWFAAAHIDEMWTWFCDLHAIVPIDAALIRAELAAMPACRHKRGRIKGPEFAAVREALGGAERATVYYIPPASQPMPVRMADRSAPCTTGAGRSADRPASGQMSGQRPALKKKPRAAGNSAADGARPGAARGWDFVPASLAAAA